jgi:hypothetical protein
MQLPGAANLFAPIFAKLDARDLRQRPGVPVWELHEPGILASQGSNRRRSIEAAKRALLTTLASQTTPFFLLHPDDPADYCAAFAWEAAGTQTWRVPRALAFDEPGLSEWLFTLGNWQAYLAPSVVLGHWPDPFRSDSFTLLSWMQKSGILALIDSFHDDSGWLLAATIPEAAA